jgi:hypothetical protein
VVSHLLFVARGELDKEASVLCELIRLVHSPLRCFVIAGYLSTFASILSDWQPFLTVLSSRVAFHLQLRSHQRYTIVASDVTISWPTIGIF